MNFQLTEDQAGVVSGLDKLLASVAGPSIQHAATYVYARELDRALSEAGFLDIARIDGFGPLEAALVTERVAREPQTVEVGASSLVGPLLPIEPGARPVALARGDGTAPTRFLPMASRLVVDRGDHAVLLAVDQSAVEPVESLFAYPYGRLASVDLGRGVRIADVAGLRRRWRIALAAEAAGAMAAALALVIEHVSTRFAFGKPLGVLQVIQHRLAMAAETAESARWLALRAAWSDTEADAALAAGFVQMRAAAFTYDLHQFSGAMGLTLEFPLHLWTYRLRALVGELGGASAQSRALAQAVWGSSSAQQEAACR